MYFRKEEWRKRSNYFVFCHSKMFLYGAAHEVFREALHVKGNRYLSKKELQQTINQFQLSGAFRKNAN